LNDDINTSERTLSDNTQLDNNSISIGGIVTENSRKMSSNDNTSTISSTDSSINKTLLLVRLFDSFSDDFMCTGAI
jgi:hypothetical protein